MPSLEYDGNFCNIMFIKFLFKDSQVLCYKKLVQNSTDLLVNDNPQMIYATIIWKKFHVWRG